MSDRQPRDAAGITRNGLRVNRDKLAAWQRRAAERYAAKQRARKNAARLTSRIDRPRPPRNDWPAKVRQMARHRSGGLCEIDGVSPAVHLHHRKSRRFGDHRIVNALHLCHACHHQVHNVDAETAEAAGWLVRSYDDPAVVAVVTRALGVVQLLDDGTYLDLAA